jgi:hypothetical protein
MEWTIAVSIRDLLANSKGPLEEIVLSTMLIPSRTFFVIADMASQEWKTVDPLPLSMHIRAKPIQRICQELH